jgi:hypothetical protein
VQTPNDKALSAENHIILVKSYSETEPFKSIRKDYSHHDGGSSGGGGKCVFNKVYEHFTVACE